VKIPVCERDTVGCGVVHAADAPEGEACVSVESLRQDRQIEFEQFQELFKLSLEGSAAAPASAENAQKAAEIAEAVVYHAEHIADLALRKIRERRAAVDAQKGTP